MTQLAQLSTAGGALAASCAPGVLEPSTQNPSTKPLEAALDQWVTAGRGDRRGAGRHSIPVPVTLTPLDGRRGSPVGPSITVVGKDLSARGVGIYHEERVPYRYCELQIEGSPFGSLTLVIELTWTRFTRLGWYESGGRVLSCSEADAA